jgi:Peptidase family M23
MNKFTSLAAAALLALPFTQAPAALAADSVPLPFDHGATARVVQGYNGGTHQGESQFGLDLVLTSQETSGAEVLSPLEGSIAWAFEPGDKTGCIEVVAKDRKFGTMMCHVLLDRHYDRGEKISRGQVLGTVGAPGTVGNNGLAHVHMELHVGGRSSDGVPFSPSNDGLLLEGTDLPFTGASNENAGVTFSSTNAVAPPPVASAPAPTPAPASRGNSRTATPAIKGCGPGVKPTFSFGFADLKAQLGDAMGDPISCEFADPAGSGDIQQQTSKGLAFWRRSTNTPTFTNGNDHWGHTPGGWVQWVGPSVDPPIAADQAHNS